ncbi:MAG: ABC transporter permease [Planctomycetota bacterium]|jgi:ABC-2 type transport system permease protein|nr:ABC transporter permease [Planctomycetota bacterium]
MREAIIIMRRELQSYFLSPIAYVFGGLFLGFMTIYTVEFGGILNHGSQAGMQGFFGLLPFVFVVFIAALTMRLWAEERKLGTLELLMTFPVTTGQIIAGKFLAGLAYLALVLLLTLGIPIVMSAHGNLDWGPVFCAYIGSLLMASAYLSVGMFASSITRDQIIALLFAFVVLLALYLMGNPSFLTILEGVLPSWLVSILGGISTFKYFGSIARGVLDTRDLVYYACFTGFFLYANALVLQGRRLKG